jgi:PPM family protein phosphatase
MKLGQTAGITDAGRRRRRNEDSFVVEPPLFVVADGMGGAQAGEVASRLAAAAFREYHEADTLSAEERLVATIQEANRRIYERAREDTEVSGMGTTVTAALLEPAAIALGHVGDSRAYRIRDGRLEQLTQDHSLVADLMRSGRLTAEEAEAHPQRSVITRALGTDPEVDVDTFTVDAEAGDVFLVCSDGLTTMVEDEDILKTLDRADDLQSAAKALVKAANRSGGEDNITVVLFSIEAGDPEAETAVIGNGRGSEDDLEDTLSGLEAPTIRRAEPASEAPAAASSSTEGRRWRRRVFWPLAILTLFAILVAAAFWGLSRANFIGAEDDGHVAIYQGIPWDLGGGVRLYRARYVSRLMVVQLSPQERAKLFDHDLVSYDRARDELGRFEAEGAP